MSPRPVPACGTNAAYQRHLRLGELPCEPCAEAARQYKRDYNARKARERTGAPVLRVVEGDAAAVPTVRCPICNARTPIEYPADDVAARMATVRHLAGSDRCARIRLSRGDRPRSLT